MARRQAADYDAEILTRIGNRTDVTAGQRSTFLRDGYLAVAKAYDHVILQGTGTEVTVIGSDQITSSIGSLWWPTHLRDITNGYIIDPEDIDVIDSYAPKGTSQPRKFYWYAGSYVFDCLAAGVYTIGVKYKIRPSMFSNFSELDEMYDPLIALKSAQLILEMVRDFDAAIALASLYTRYEKERGLVPIAEERKNDHRTGFRVRLR